jgi:2-amino-4-hydroxy-6-hydroxymethyldihydropteridine diphosphokinase
MILLGLGGNLPTAAYGSPQATLEAALRHIEAAGIGVVARSRWYRSAPVPVSDQPWFVNGVAALATALGPEDLLRALHGVEARFGRRRRARNEARPLDLDLLAYGDLLRDGPAPPVLPHPRLHERAFVLRPLAEVAPRWRHPRLGLAVEALLAALPPGQAAEPIEGE